MYIMKININFAVPLIMILIFTIIVSCGKKQKMIEGEYIVVDSIRLEKPTYFNTFKKVKSGFVGINKYEKRLELISNTGKLLSSFGEVGKGPGEFINPHGLDVFDNRLYLADPSLGKIVIVKLNNDNEFEYLKEFMVDCYIIDFAVSDEEYIFISTSNDKNNIHLYDTDGEFVNNFSTIDFEPVGDFKTMVKHLSYVYTEDEFLIIPYISSLRLEFYKYTSNELEKISETKLDYGKSEVVERKNAMEILGIGPCFFANNNFYVSADPRLSGKLDFSCYSFIGKYLGKYMLKNYKSNDYISLAASSDGQTIWFMDIHNNDRTIYVAEKNDNL